jgi:molecular chaperone DnaK
LKTPIALRPGKSSDVINIPIYQGDYNAEGTKAFYNHFVTNVSITGDDVPALVPENSAVNLTIKVQRDEQMTFSVYFPVIEYSFDIETKIGIISVPDADMINEYIEQAQDQLESLTGDNQTESNEKISSELQDLKIKLEQGGSDYDRRSQVLTGLKKQQIAIDILQKEEELPKMIKNLKDVFFELDELVKKINENHWADGTELSMQNVNAGVTEFRHKIDKVLKGIDNPIQQMRAIKDLTEEMGSLDFVLRDALAGVQMRISWLKYMNENFGKFKWRDEQKAQALINKGISMSLQNPSADELLHIIREITVLLPKEEQTKLVRGF